MAIIGISGYSGSGKDTVGIIIQYLNCTNVGEVTIEDACKDYNLHEWWLEDQSGWEIMKFAGKLKDIAAHLTGIDREMFEDQEFKKTELDPEWNIPSEITLVDGKVNLGEYKPMTVRDLLQKLGTECMRTGLHTNTWVNALFADYKPISYNDDVQPELPNWIITDTRFPNEAKAIKDKGGIIIRVERPGVEAINAHPSETGLDNWKFDYKIANVSDLFELKQSVLNVLKHAGLL
jgi:hypothetical protein